MQSCLWSSRTNTHLGIGIKRSCNKKRSYNNTFHIGWIKLECKWLFNNQFVIYNTLAGSQFKKVHSGSDAIQTHLHGAVGKC